jgi:hypothetical protein
MDSQELSQIAACGAGVILGAYMITRGLFYALHRRPPFHEQKEEQINETLNVAIAMAGGAVFCVSMLARK